jgi:hypothetical protein
MKIAYLIPLILLFSKVSFSGDQFPKGSTLKPEN